MSQQDSLVFDRLLERIRGHQLAAMIHLAARWDLQDRVGEGRPLAELAAELKAHPKSLGRLFRALAAFDVFSVDEHDRVTPTVASRFLGRNAPRSLHAAASFWSIPAAWESWGDLHHSIRTGESAFEHRFDWPFFSHLAATPSDGEAFQRFMSNSPEDRHAAVVQACDFKRFRTVADIGGGNGRLLAHVLRAAPAARGILYDRADVLDARPPELEELRSQGRCEIVPGDFFDRVPAGADAYLLSQILHDWDDDSALRILRRVREAAPPDARLLVIERLLGPHTHPNDLLSDIEMLVLHKSAERSAAEFDLLLKQAGWRAGHVIPTTSTFSVIESAPA